MVSQVKEVDIEYRSQPDSLEPDSKHPLYNEIKRKVVKTSIPLVEISKIATYWDKGIPVIYYLNTYSPDGSIERKPIKFDNMLNKGAIDSSLAFMTGRQKLWENLAKTANLVKPMPWLLIGLIVMAMIMGGFGGASLYNPLNHTEPISNAPTKVVVWNVTNTFTFTSQSQPTTGIATVTVTASQSTPSVITVTTISIPTNSTATTSSSLTTSSTTTSTVTNSTTTP